MILLHNYGLLRQLFALIIVVFWKESVVSSKLHHHHEIPLDICYDIMDNGNNCSSPLWTSGDEGTKLVDSNVKLFLRMNGANHGSGRLYGSRTKNLPFNCHILTKDEEPTESNAFIYGGCPYKNGVAIYVDMTPVRVEFTLTDLLDGTYAYAEAYSISCLYAECKKKRTEPEDSYCPVFDHCTRRIAWEPSRKHLGVGISRGYLSPRTKRQFPMIE